MALDSILKKFEDHFDCVGIIPTQLYNAEAKKHGYAQTEKNYPSMLVLAYAYPKRIKKHSKTHLIPSFYTFGRDYHLVLKDKIKLLCQDLDLAYDYGVDNHPLNERLMAQLAGLGFFGKNQLIINQAFGSYIFLAYVLMDTPFTKTYKQPILDNCGDCRRCIDACPTGALFDGGYITEKCISYYNQEKKPLTPEQIKKNYQLFGCDICQLVCPKNVNKGHLVHKEFELSGKEAVSIKDLFTLSQKEFKNTYKDMAYLWKGKTLLMRNAATLLLNHKNTAYNDLIQASLSSFPMPWYQQTTRYILDALKKID